MSTTVVLETRYRASDPTTPANRGTDDTREVKPRVGHLVRGGWTLCGRRADSFTWVDPDETTVPCQNCSEVPEGQLTHHDMCATGITYRQLDYWSRRGWLRPNATDVGSGNRRTFPPEELPVVRIMAVLTRSGVHPLVAHAVARDGGELAPGVRVVIEPELLDAPVLAEAS